MLTINEDKTKITNINNTSANFLGYRINGTNAKHYQSRKIRIGKIKKRAPFGSIKLHIPLERIRDALISKGLVNPNGKAKYFGP